MKKKFETYKWLGITCKYPGCTFQARSRGYCKTHASSRMAKEERKLNDAIRRSQAKAEPNSGI